MAEIPINLFTLIFGTLIFGLGYMGLFFRYAFLNKAKKFYNELPVLDKIVQSIILGVLSFILTNSLFLRVEKMSSEAEILNYIINSPSIFLYQFFFVIIIIYSLIILELFVMFLNEYIKKKLHSTST